MRVNLAVCSVLSLLERRVEDQKAIKVCLIAGFLVGELTRVHLHLSRRFQIRLALVSLVVSFLVSRVVRGRVGRWLKYLFIFIERFAIIL